MPFLRAAVESVEVDPAVDAMRDAGAGILPEQPVATGIDLGGMGSDGAQPEGIVEQFAAQVVAIEIRSRVDDRAWP